MALSTTWLISNWKEANGYCCECPGVWKWCCHRGCNNQGCVATSSLTNGYRRWPTTIPHLKDTCNRSELRVSQWIGALRKDEECTFGILKGCRRILKTDIRVHNMEVSDNIWMTSCDLHNLLLDVDGLSHKWEDGFPSSYKTDNGRSKTRIFLLPFDVSSIRPEMKVTDCEHSTVCDSDFGMMTMTTTKALIMFARATLIVVNCNDRCLDRCKCEFDRIPSVQSDVDWQFQHSFSRKQTEVTKMIPKEFETSSYPCCSLASSTNLNKGVLLTTWCSLLATLFHCQNSSRHRKSIAGLW